MTPREAAIIIGKLTCYSADHLLEHAFDCGCAFSQTRFSFSAVVDEARTILDQYWQAKIDAAKNADGGGT